MRCSTPFLKLLVPLKRKKLCRTLTNYAPDQRANDTTLDIRLTDRGKAEEMFLAPITGSAHV